MGKIILVGGGVAGLGAGIRLSEYGHECILLEKNAEAGGCLGGWVREGYLIDGCLHWLNGSARGELNRLWRETGMLGGVPTRRAPIFYSVELGGKRAALGASLLKTERSLLSLSPIDREEILRFLNAVRTVNATRNARGLEALSARGRLMEVTLFYGRLSLRGLAERFVSPLLRLLLTGFFGGDYSAAALLFAYAAYVSGDADLPVGGSVAAAERMAERFLSLGGTIRTNAEVRHISLSGNRAAGVVLADATVLRGDAVIAAIEPDALFGRLLPGDTMPPTLKRVFAANAGGRFSAMGAAFGADAASVPAFGTLIFDAPALPFGGRLILREFSHEPAFAPRGKVCLEALSMLSGGDAEKVLRLSEKGDRSEYRALKARFAEACAAEIEARFPEAADSLTLLDTWSPATYRDAIGSPSGSFLPFLLPPSTVPYRLSPSVPAVKNLFLASSWLLSPGGLPGAVRAGIHAAESADHFLSKRENRTMASAKGSISVAKL